MATAERELFPLIGRLEAGLAHEGDRAHFGRLRAALESDHDEAGRVVRLLRTVTDRYEPPARACATLRGLYRPAPALARAGGERDAAVQRRLPGGGAASRGGAARGVRPSRRRGARHLRRRRLPPVGGGPPARRHGVPAGPPGPVPAGCGVADAPRGEAPPAHGGPDEGLHRLLRSGAGPAGGRRDRAHRVRPDAADDGAGGCAVAETPPILELDVNSPDDLSSVAEDLSNRWGRLDGVLHAIAFAPEDALGGKFMSAPPSSAELAFAPAPIPSRPWPRRFRP